MEIIHHQTCLNLFISVVIPVYNGAEFLKKNLPALVASADSETEIILVDDGSTDNSVEIGEQFGAKIISLNKNSGSAHARNIGVEQSKGEIILFIDADVVVQPETIQNLREIFAAKPEYSALFGSYDDAPAAPDFFSQYRNLMHHFFHQTGNSEAETFWSGFGAIKRQVFLELGGFNHKDFEIPSVEDIELGYRLREKGHRILLVPKLQVKHLKKWTFYSILRTDFWQRAVPWTELLLSNPNIKQNLNAGLSQKISAVLAGLLIITIGLSVWKFWWLLFSFSILLVFIGINREFYKFFLKRKGFWFTLLVFPMHLLYFFYSSLAFAYSWVNVKILGRKMIVR